MLNIYFYYVVQITLRDVPFSDKVERYHATHC